MRRVAFRKCLFSVGKITTFLAMISFEVSLALADNAQQLEDSDFFRGCSVISAPAPYLTQVLGTCLGHTFSKDNINKQPACVASATNRYWLIKNCNYDDKLVQYVAFDIASKQLRQVRLVDGTTYTQASNNVIALANSPLQHSAENKAIELQSTRQADNASFNAETPSIANNNPSKTNISMTRLTLARDAFDKGDYTTAFREYKDLAETGNLEAQQRLGNMYEVGLGVTQDATIANTWYKKAVAQVDTGVTDPGAMTSLAWLYDMGKGVSKDQNKAIAWYKKAAITGFARAQLNLGLSYKNGEGIAKDDKQAIVWFRKAAEQGNAEAQLNLGWMYESARGTEKNEVEAEIWYLRAAQQGNLDAQKNLAGFYRDGRGIAQDDKQAAIWFRKAAEQGDSEGQYNLANMYKAGRGMAKDDEQAVYWYHQAAEQGNAQAQSSLGFAYASGFGVKKDIAQARVWLQKAAAQGDIVAQAGLNILRDASQISSSEASNIAK